MTTGAQYVSMDIEPLGSVHLKYSVTKCVVQPHLVQLKHGLLAHRRLWLLFTVVEVLVHFNVYSSG
jgi:hypothetical protein